MHQDIRWCGTTFPEPAGLRRAQGEPSLCREGAVTRPAAERDAGQNQFVSGERKRSPGVAEGEEKGVKRWNEHQKTRHVCD